MVIKHSKSTENDFFEDTENSSSKDVQLSSSIASSSSTENLSKQFQKIKPELKFLESETDPNCVYIGKKKSVLKQYGNIGNALIGKVAEEDQKNKLVYLDGLNPHVIFLDGARGTGKSYVLGVIAEQLSKNNLYIGQIVVDPVGVFWSMKFPNKEKKEISILQEWGLKPEGVKNLKVFVPFGLSQNVSKETFDDYFSMSPSMLTVDDWCLTFGIDRFSPSGLLLEKTIDYVKKGYTVGGTQEKKDVKSITGKGNNYTLEDIIFCLQNASDFLDQKKGYKPDSIRALSSRFDAAKSWGIFSDSGTPLSKLSREGQLTVLDTSLLEENITALVIGILARRILSARKMLAREEAIKKLSKKEMDAEELLEIEIPPTWLYIDEAHTLIPAGNLQTPASSALIEYVKQGRRPGCSLVFATQQPSAINTKVLSQVDILISHKLIFNDDIHAIQKRMPAIIPNEYKDPNFIKTLPFATALVGDRSEETSRAFILRVAPRASQHEGRDMETIRDIKKLSNSQVLNIAYKLIYEKLEKNGSLKLSVAQDILDVVNSKYKTNVLFEDVLEKLLANDVVLIKNVLSFKTQNSVKNIDSQNVDAEETFEEPLDNKEEIVQHVLLKENIKYCLPLRINNYEIQNIAKASISKGLFFQSKEKIKDIVLKYRLIYKISYNLYLDNDQFKRMTCYIDSVTGEFIHFLGIHFKESKGFPLISEFSDKDLDILYLLKSPQPISVLEKKLNLSESDIIASIDLFKSKNILVVSQKNKVNYFKVNEDVFDIPFDAQHKLLMTLDGLPLKKENVADVEQIVFDINKIKELLIKLWGDIEFVSFEEIYWPLWNIFLTNKSNTEKVIVIDGVLGQKI